MRGFGFGYSPHLVGSGSSSSPVSTLLDGLVASYKFDGNSNDSVGNFNGSDNAISYNSSYGVVNEGANFNGVNGYIELQNSQAGLAFIQNTLTFTIAMWVRPVDYTATFFLMGNSGTGTDKGFFLGSQTDGEVQFACFDGAGNFPINSTASDFFTDNSYVLIFVVGDGDNVNFYKGTTLFSGDTRTLPLPTGNSERNVAIGRINGSSTGNFNGDMDIVSVWNRALTTDEMAEYYNGGTGKQYPFLAGLLWILAGGIWSDSGIWYDASNWIG